MKSALLKGVSAGSDLLSLHPFLVMVLFCLTGLSWHFGLTLEIRLFHWNCDGLETDSFWNWAVSTETVLAFSPIALKYHFY